MTDRLPVATIKHQLVGRIRELVQVLAPGGRWHGAYWQGPNPTRAKDSRTSFTIWQSGAWKEYDSDEKGDAIDLVAYCRRCDRGQAIAWAKDWLGLTHLDSATRARLDAQARQRDAERRRADEAARADKQRRAFQMWLRAEPVRATGPVGLYLAMRLDGAGLADIDNREQDLREIPALDYWGPQEPGATGPRHRGPALVAAIRQMNGEISGVHATFVKPDGSGKAAVTAPKLMLGTKMGGAVRLSRGAAGLAFDQLDPDGGDEDLVVTEGIETGLAVALEMPELRVWAALDLGNIGQLSPHPAIRRLLVCTERDTKPVAIEQRRRVLDGLATKGFDLVEVPAPVGKDFNDTLNQ
jgi:hypothetical protein